MVSTTQLLITVVMIVLGWLRPSSNDLQLEERQFPGAFQDVVYKQTDKGDGEVRESEQDRLEPQDDEDADQPMRSVRDVSASIRELQASLTSLV